VGLLFAHNLDTNRMCHIVLTRFGVWCVCVRASVFLVMCLGLCVFKHAPDVSSNCGDVWADDLRVCVCVCRLVCVCVGVSVRVCVCVCVGV
jgi:hypothetical protein